jgi:4-amino-4-deoxy-L-arabinose transferase-like glycosyltransferase
MARMRDVRLRPRAGQSVQPDATGSLGNRDDLAASQGMVDRGGLSAATRLPLTALAGTGVERVLRAVLRRAPLLVPVLLAFAMLAMAMPGFMTLPPIDRDEASFAQSSRQMAETGDIVDIRLGEAPRHKKPVGIYWLQAGTVRLAELVAPRTSAPTAAGPADHIATYRTVSLVAAMLAVLLTSQIGAVLAGGPSPATGLGIGAMAGVLLGSSVLLGAEARLAKTDAALLVTVLAMMLPLARAWMGRPPGRVAAFGFWAALGASLLIKGPIGLMTVGLAVAALALVRRDIRWLSGFRPLVGLAVVAVIVLPWYAAITVRTGWAFWQASLGRDLIGKVAEGQESHGAPPGTYLALVWLTFAPGAAVLALGLPALWRGRRDARLAPALAFCLAWALPTWIVFEAVATKLVHYVLPAYPALAILAAIGWQATPDPLASLARRVVAAVLLVVPVAVAVAVAALSLRYGGPIPVFAILGIAGMILSALAFWAWARAGRRWAAAAAVLPMGFCLSLAVYPTLARVPAIWPSAAMGRAVAEFGLCAAPEAIVTGYAEPSALFTLGGGALAPSPEAAADRAAAAPCAIVFVADGAARNFAARAAELGLKLADRGWIEGTNIGSGKRVRIAVLGKAPE